MTHLTSLLVHPFGAEPCELSSVGGANGFSIAVASLANTQTSTGSSGPTSAANAAGNSGDTATTTNPSPAPNPKPAAMPGEGEPVNPYHDAKYAPAPPQPIVSRSIGWTEAADAWRKYHAASLAAARAEVERMREVVAAVDAWQTAYADLECTSTVTAAMEIAILKYRAASLSSPTVEKGAGK